MAATESKTGGTLITQAIGQLRGRGQRDEGRNNPFGYLFIAPALILYLVFNLWPMFRGFAMAFTDYRFIS
jgi:ABC-type sugar transport system permease subunit